METSHGHTQHKAIARSFACEFDGLERGHQQLSMAHGAGPESAGSTWDLWFIIHNIKPIYIYTGWWFGT